MIRRAPVSNPLSRPTLAALVLLGLWFGLDFVGAPRLVDREPVMSLAGLMLGLLVAFLVAGACRTRFMAPVYSLALVVWILLQVETHWSSYVFPASPAKLRWYDRVFGDHIHLLPSLPERTTPDAYHTTLALLLLLNLALAIRDVFRRASPASALEAGARA